MTNRALILAALSDGPSTIRHALRSRDTELMIDALRSLGVEISVLDADSRANMTLEVVPHFLGSVDARSIDVGLAGTVMRFLPPVAGLTHGDVMFDGDRAARRRPMATLIEAMRDVGMEVDDAGTGTLPGRHPRQQPAKTPPASLEKRASSRGILISFDFSAAGGMVDFFARPA